MRKHTSILVALRSSLEKNPEDADLRVHLASVLLEDGETQAALDECTRALQSIPDHLEALELAERAALSLQLKERAHGYRRLLDALGPAPEKEAKSPRSPEAQVRPIVPAEVPADPVGTAPVGLARVIQLPNTKSLDPRLLGADIDRPALSLKDVGGLEQVKRRLETSFLGPLKNPELRRAYGKSLRGGLLLYGPPGCGKTFVARALAGELKAHFLNVGLDMVLDMYIGQSEKNLHELFESARRMAPCVVFFDEVDALGRKRVQLGASGGRGAVVQLLTELDGFADANDGVYCLAATNHPWDVDSALRRPGRFDRTVFVSPPDLHAREAILRTHLEERPAGAIDVSLLASQSSGFSGADLAHWIDSAVEFALSDSIELGTARPLAMTDFERALLEIKPSTRAWFAMAKNYAQFANEDGQYDDLAAYLRDKAG